MDIDSRAISLGLLGELFSISHALGYYRSVCVTASYSLSQQSSLESPVSRSGLRLAIQDSLQTTIRQHPALRYGLAERKKGLARKYTPLDQFSHEDLVEYVENSCSASGEALDAALCRLIETAHGELWQSHKPAWRIIALEHGAECQANDDGQLNPPPTRIDIAFISHHAIVDGLSAVSFHTSLMENLKPITECLEPRWPLVLDDVPLVPKSIEDCLDYSSCACKKCIHEDGNSDKAWTGAVVHLPSISSFRSRIRLVHLPPERLAETLRYCRGLGITLTALLHGLICASLCRGVEDAPGFRAVTPYSIRKYTRATSRDIVDHVASLTSYIPGATLRQIESCAPYSREETVHIIDLSREIGGEISVAVADFPHGSGMAMLSRIPDLESYCQGKMGKERSNTYEVSNLGLAPTVSLLNQGTLHLEKMVFTQCGTVSGPALTFNCVSIPSGPLTIAITWQEGVVEERLVDHLESDLQKRLLLAREQDD